jgi:hypothetical protein
MSNWVWMPIALGLWVLIVVVGLSLSKAAGDADRRAEEMLRRYKEEARKRDSRK